MRWLIPLMLSVASSSVAAPPPLSGDWVVMAGKTPLMLVNLNRQPNGDAGTVTRPRSMSVGVGQAFDSLEGPAITQRIATAKSVGKGWELTLVPRQASEQLTVLTFRVDPRGMALLGWKGAELDEVPIERAASDTKLPPSWEKGRVYYVEVDYPTNAEMAALFRADQADRAPGPGGIDWAKAELRDKARRVRTKALLNSGKLASGDDYFHAAFIFQHGDDPDSYLLAHVLATTAVARGRRDAAWIAAATLDRYLQAIGQKQIFGTQYSMPPDSPATQEPYDPKLIPDSLRTVAGVGTLAGQAERRANLDKGRTLKPKP